MEQRGKSSSSSSSGWSQTSLSMSLILASSSRTTALSSHGMRACRVTAFLRTNAVARTRIAARFTLPTCLALRFCAVLPVVCVPHAFAVYRIHYLPAVVPLPCVCCLPAMMPRENTRLEKTCFYVWFVLCRFAVVACAACCTLQTYLTAVRLGREERFLLPCRKHVTHGARLPLPCTHAFMQTLLPLPDTHYPSFTALAFCLFTATISSLGTAILLPTTMMPYHLLDSQFYTTFFYSQHLFYHLPAVYSGLEKA